MLNYSNILKNSTQTVNKNLSGLFPTQNVSYKNRKVAYDIINQILNFEYKVFF